MAADGYFRFRLAGRLWFLSFASSRQWQLAEPGSMA